jgi:predicted N-acetyltransferase YhbS
VITLRTASDSDVPAIVALLNAAFAMERSFIDRDRTSAPEVERYMTTGTFSVVDGTASVVDGTVSALASCMYLEQRKDRLYLGMLAVNPSQQGRGLGKQMITAAERRAASLGCRALDIRIVDLRTELPPFYRALGFVDNGTEPLVDPQLRRPAHFIRMTKTIGT